MKKYCALISILFVLSYCCAFKKDTSLTTEGRIKLHPALSDVYYQTTAQEFVKEVQELCFVSTNKQIFITFLKEQIFACDEAIKKQDRYAKVVGYCVNTWPWVDVISYYEQQPAMANFIGSFSFMNRLAVEFGLRKVLGVYCERMAQHEQSGELQQVTKAEFENLINKYYSTDELAIIQLIEGKKFAQEIVKVLESL